MAETSTYLLFVADLERSRSRAEHERMSERVARLAQLLSERYSDLTAVPPGVVDGDRLQVAVAVDGVDGGVAARRAAQLVELICETDLRLGGVPLVHALTRGPLSVGHGNGSSIHGGALDAALQALEDARSERLFLGAAGFPDDGAVRGAFSGLGVLMRGWTRRQSQFVRALLQDGVLDFGADGRRFLPERKRKEVAERFSVSPSVVTESLQAAQVRAFRDCMWGAAAALEHQGFGVLVGV